MANGKGRKKPRLQCRVMEEVLIPKPRLVERKVLRVCVSKPLTDEIYAQLRALISTTLKEIKKKSGKMTPNSVVVGFYLGRSGDKPLVGSIYCSYCDFGKGDLCQDNLRIAFENAWQAAQPKVPAE